MRKRSAKTANCNCYNHNPLLREKQNRRSATRQKLRKYRTCCVLINYSNVVINSNLMSQWEVRTITIWFGMRRPNWHSPLSHITGLHCVGFAVIFFVHSLQWIKNSITDLDEMNQKSPFDSLTRIGQWSRKSLAEVIYRFLHAIMIEGLKIFGLVPQQLHRGGWTNCGAIEVSRQLITIQQKEGEIVSPGNCAKYFRSQNSATDGGRFHLQCFEFWTVLSKGKAASVSHITNGLKRCSWVSAFGNQNVQMLVSVIYFTEVGCKFIEIP